MRSLNLTMIGTAHRLKISTTIAPETHDYLTGLVERGRATTIAEAIDQAVLRARSAESAEQLAHDTTVYFETLGSDAGAEESKLEAALAQAADEINFDN